MNLGVTSTFYKLNKIDVILYTFNFAQSATLNSGVVNDAVRCGGRATVNFGQCKGRETIVYDSRVETIKRRDERTSDDRR